MKTTITGRHGRTPIVTHTLDEGEDWAHFNMNQPGRSFSHDEGIRDIISCAGCNRSLRNLRPGSPRPGARER